MKPRLLSSLASCLLLASGCAPDAPPPGTSASPSSASSHPALDDRLPLSWHLKNSEVLGPGQGLHVLRKIPTDRPGTQVLDVLSDGRLVVRRGSALYLESPAGHRSTTVPLPYVGASRGVFAVDDDGRHLVWVTTSTDDYFHLPWRMFSVDLRTGETRELARHPDIGMGPVPVVPDGTHPVLIGGRVYYAAARRLDPRQHRAIPAIYSVPVDGSTRPRVEVDDAYGAMRWGSRLVYVTSDWGFLAWQLHSRMPENPRTDQIIATGPGRAHRLSGWSSDGRTLAWQERRPRDNCVVHLLPRHGERITLGPDWCEQVWFGYLHVGGEWLAAATGAGPYRTHVVRIADGSLYRLTADPTSGVSLGHAGVITWQPDRGPDKGKTIVARLAFG